MKKKIMAVTLTAALSIPFVSANADSMVSNISNALSNDESINILYNNTLVEYEDVKPINADGRVMIPFRAALENMGATVEYDESQRLVTAVKGDTSISFVLMDDVINVDKNGKKSVVKMDVPMMIVSDRTLVPIRFMSEAFDMNIGWDSESETVLILDTNDFFKKFDEIAPNLTKMTTLKMPVYTKENATFNAGLNVAEKNYSLTGKIDATYIDEASNLNITFETVLDDKEIKNSTINLIVKGSECYFKTDLIEQLTKISDSEKVKLAALTLNQDSWYKVDLNTFIDETTIIPNEAKGVIKQAFKMQQGENVDFAELLENMVILEEGIDIDRDTLMNLAMQMDMYGEIDKYITVTEGENGSSSITMDISNSDFDSILSSTYAATISENEIKELCDLIDFDMNVSTEFDEKQSNAKIVFNMGIGDILKVTFDMDDNTEVDNTVKAAEIPTEFIDVTSLIVDLI